MAAPQNHWKLGLFVIAGLTLLLAVVALLGARSMRKEVGLYASFFDESVQGLEVGSPIKFRGVTVGTVGRIQVAPDHRHVEVESELVVDELARLGLDDAEEPVRFGRPRKLVMAPDLRLQLASSGLTGVKFLQLDFFDVAAYPPPVLPFPVPENYIPTAASMMKNLEDSITRMANTLPEITDRAASILGRIDTIVRQVDEHHIPAQIANTLDSADALFATARLKLEQLDTDGLSRDGRKTLAGAMAAVARVDELLVRVGRDDGLLARIERAGGAIGDILSDARGLGGQLVDTLVSVQSAARSMRKLTEALEQDPDMLMKGRAPEKKP
jgi:ABC-type transporter Mla subunit MlaD